MSFSIALAQINPLVGDIPANTQHVLSSIAQARKAGARLLLLPELALTGYPPEDLLLRPSLQPRIEQALAQIATAVGDLYVVLGYPIMREGKLFNAAGVFYRGKLLTEYRKQCLPNYQVFDEKRYFAAGDQPCLFDLDGTPVALTICEDIWQEHPMQQAKNAGARLMLSINASPFHNGKQDERETLFARRARAGAIPIVYLNMVGGQDELVFDGSSCALNSDGTVCARAFAFEEEMLLLEARKCSEQICIDVAKLAPLLSEEAATYQALVCGLRDYVNKNSFARVVLGLSGGIDSALTLALAVDALGADRVEAVMMPYHYTAAMSMEDAESQARTLGVAYSVIPIAPAFNAFMDMLTPHFANTKRDTTEENLQARCRGLLLMAISNKKGALVLTTGNKSEIAVGYCTLYGDMVGGFAPLKDVPKTWVYRLAAYRNSLSAVIPQRVIDRPPSAELAPDQKDQDSLPTYDILDEILARYVEQDESCEEIISAGFAADTVKRVLRLVDANEYKRRQSAVGVRISQRGFGRDRRYPITNGWRAGE